MLANLLLVHWHDVDLDNVAERDQRFELIPVQKVIQRQRIATLLQFLDTLDDRLIRFYVFEDFQYPIAKPKD